MRSDDYGRLTVHRNPFELLWHQTEPPFASSTNSKHSDTITLQEPA